MNAYNAAAWLVDRHVHEGRAERTAIRSGGTTITYGDVHGGVQSAQRALGSLGLAPGDRVAMVVNDEPAFVLWFLGAMRGGFVPVPLSTMLTANELSAIVDDSGAIAIAVSAMYAGHLPRFAERCPSLAHALVFGDTTPATGRLAVHNAAEFGPATIDVTSTKADTPAFWLYSSGTTGLPKGVIHSHRDMQATADTYATEVLRTTPEDRFFSVAKLFFAYGLGNSLTFPFAVGGTAVLDARRPSPTTVLETVAAERPTLLFASPGFVAALLDARPDPAALASVRAAVTAGEALPADLQRRYTDYFGHPVLDGIGTTEALHIFISNTLDHQQPGSSGRAVLGYELDLRDDEGRAVIDAGAPGYLHVRGPSTATGYWKRPDETSAVFLDDHWLKTGDVYVRSEAGQWTFLGRNSDMIKAGGIWVSPAEVESVLIEHDDVLEAAVVGARNDVGLETTVAFVVAASGRTIDPVALDAHCRERMAAFKRPREILVVDKLPRTATGKIQRFALRERLATSAAS